MHSSAPYAQLCRYPIAQRLFVCAAILVALNLASLVKPALAQPLIHLQGTDTVTSSATGPADAFPLASNDVYRSPDSQHKLLPKAAGAYLTETPSDVGRPQLVIAYYNLTEGLLAGYQSSTGKRLLLRAQWLPNGAVNPEVAHLNAATGQIELLMGQTKKLDLGTGKRAKTYEVAGVDFMSRLNEARSRGVGSEQGELSRFIEADAGRAFAQAMPALYVALEPLETDPKLAALQAPFGGVLTALQLITGVNGGFDDPDAVVGPSAAIGLRENCGSNMCQYRGRHFMVQKSGLFDILSKGEAGFAKKLAERGLSQTPRSLLQTLADSRKNGDGTCTDPGPRFGYCGPGTFTPGDIQTLECAGHDLCVCKWGYAACALEVPTTGGGCGGCNNLVEAIWSYLDAIFTRRFEYDPMEGGPGEEIIEWW